MADSANPSTYFEVPTYTIYFGQDGALQFDPPQDSPELAIALSIAFPLPKTFDEKLRAAQISFLCNWKRSTSETQDTNAPASIPVQHHPAAYGNNVQPSNVTARHIVNPPSQVAEHRDIPTPSQPRKRPRKSRAKAPTIQPTEGSTAMVHTWDMQSGELKQKNTKRTYGVEEAKVVFQNRNNICDYHKAKRTKVGKLSMSR